MLRSEHLTFAKRRWEEGVSGAGAEACEKTLRPRRLGVLGQLGEGGGLWAGGAEVGEVSGSGTMAISHVWVFKFRSIKIK